MWGVGLAGCEDQQVLGKAFKHKINMSIEPELSEPEPPTEEPPSFDSPRKEKTLDTSFGEGSEEVVSAPTNILRRLRELLAAAEIDAFIVGSADAHQSEYVSESESRRQFLSGFSGSAGTALVTQEEALLWTDGRYFLQASNELSSDWILMRQGDKGVPDMNDWLVQNLSRERTVGIDSSLMTATAAKCLENKLKTAGVRLIGVTENPVDKVWEQLGTKPSRPTAKVTMQSLDYAGISHQEKLSKVRETLTECSADGIILSMLDEVVWLYNIRGADVMYNPVAYSFAFVTHSSAVLFIDLNKVTEITLDGVEFRDYDEVDSFLKGQASEGKRVLADSNQLNWRLVQALGSCHVEKASPITLAKSLKNEAELKGIADAHLRDGTALTAFLAWLEDKVQNGDEITEYRAAEVLESFRAKMDKNVGLSFSTIAGYGPNGAIIHYRPDKETSAKIGTDSLFLLDSGGQYLDGTTDTTRTLHFGVPDEKMKRCYTLVLKGQIALSRAVFPEGTLGSRLDSLARMPLWSAGLDYNHGTGHGVVSSHEYLVPAIMIIIYTPSSSNVLFLLFTLFTREHS